VQFNKFNQQLQTTTLIPNIIIKNSLRFTSLCVSVMSLSRRPRATHGPTIEPIVKEMDRYEDSAHWAPTNSSQILKDPNGICQQPNFISIQLNYSASLQPYVYTLLPDF
jgi:hypothetical protein